MGIAKLKSTLVRIPYFNSLVAAPLFLAFVLPNLLEPQWIWRMVLLALASLGLFLLSLRILTIPEILEKDLGSANGTARRVLFILAYTGGIGLTIATLYFGGKSTIDLLNQENLRTEKVIVEATRTGGASVLVGQNVTFSGISYTLPFYWGIVKPNQEYTVVYSPATRIIYEIQPTGEESLRREN